MTDIESLRHLVVPRELGAVKRFPPGPTVQQVMDGDSQAIPEILREESQIFIGDADIAVERYLSRAFHEAEMEHVWGKVWQAACRERDIPNPGDHIIYEIGKESIIIARAEDGAVRAFPNACLHRGTQLRTCSGNVEHFRCPYHGMTWSLSGKIKAIPASWDFPHVDAKGFDLPVIRTGTWGGFIFICLSDETESLEDYLETLPQYFREWPYEDRYKVVHVGKVIGCNWKVAMDAFLEAYHVRVTHWQTEPYGGDVTVQYDIWPEIRHVNRVLSCIGVMTPVTPPGTTEQTMLDAMMVDITSAGKKGAIALKEGERARTVLAERLRKVLGKSTGYDFSKVSDAELLDSHQYHVFPNFVPWSGIGAPIVYRFRPNGDNHEECIMEVMLLYVRNDPPPSDAPLRMLDQDQQFADAVELGGLGPVLDQDVDNLVKVQRGMKAAHKRGVTLANYQEIRIRRYHHILDDYIFGE